LYKLKYVILNLDMDSMLINDVMDISLQAGVLILENGGETYRAEETCVNVAKSLGATDASAFVTPTVVIVTVTDKDHKAHTAMQRITNRTVNLRKISQVNNLTRRLSLRGKRTNLSQAENLLAKIRQAPGHSKGKLLWMAGFSAFFFSLMFGGNWKEAITAFVIGMILRIELIFLEKFHLNSFILSVISGGLISILCELVIVIGIVPATITVMTAVLMQVVPGMAIVNAIRDLIAGDLIAGTARLVDAFMVAAGLSVGSVFGVLVFSHVLG